MCGRKWLRLPAPILGLGVAELRRHNHQICIGIVRRRFTPNVRSSIQVGEDCVTVERAKRNTKHHIEKIRRKDMQLR